MSAGFTPGPWVVNPFVAQVDCGTISQKGGLLPVCQMLWPTGERTEAETEANARLITAAPELYAALRHLNELAKMPDRPLREWTEAKAEADAILAKARGEA